MYGVCLNLRVLDVFRFWFRREEFDVVYAGGREVSGCVETKTARSNGIICSLRGEAAAYSSAEILCSAD